MQRCALLFCNVWSLFEVLGRKVAKNYFISTCLIIIFCILYTHHLPYLIFIFKIYYFVPTQYIFIITGAAQQDTVWGSVQTSGPAIRTISKGASKGAYPPQKGTFSPFIITELICSSMYKMCWLLYPKWLSFSNKHRANGCCVVTSKSFCLSCIIADFFCFLLFAVCCLFF